MNDKPCAAAGFTSYRYKGQYGWIMIGANSTKDALNEASRSIQHHAVSVDHLEIYANGRYQPV